MTFGDSVLLDSSSLKLILVACTEEYWPSVW